jgi:hypothetical protein
LRSCKGTNQAAGFLAKGQNLKQRAISLVKQAEKFENPVWVCLDHSRFDAHVHGTLLKAEHKVYKTVRLYHPELVGLLKAQLSNLGVTKGGVEYRARGKRMSGDVNTALGNSILNYGMLSAWLEASGVKGEIFLDGDDSVVTLERRDLDKLLPVEPFMLKLGMKTEFEVVYDFCKVEFCQARVVWSRNGPWMCPNPRKRLSVLPISATNVGGEEALQLLAGKVACELGCTDDVPLMRPYVELVRQLGTRPYVRTNRSDYRTLQKGGEVGWLKLADWVEPDELVRTSFERSWGITALEQIAFEKEAKFIVCQQRGKAPNHKVREPTLGADWFDGVDETNGDHENDLDWESQSPSFQAYALGLLVG